MFGIDDAALAMGGSAVVSGLMGSEASEKAGEAQVKAAKISSNASSAANLQMRRDLAPYRGAGESALQRLMHMMGVGDPNAGKRDAAARKAGLRKPTWDDASAEFERSHNAWAGHGFTENSDPAVVEKQTQRIFDAMTQKWEGQVGSMDVGSDGPDDEFGSLTRDFSLKDFQADPGYQFRLQEGEKALQRGSVARGMARSTPGLKSLMRFSSDLASQEYGAAYGRDMTNRSFKVGNLQQLAGSGQNAAAMTGSAGVTAAGQMGTAALAAGQASAAGTMGAASSWNNAIQGGLGNFMYQKRFDEMMKRMPVFGTTTTPSPMAYSGMMAPV
jgi:hypothetical protein